MNILIISILLLFGILHAQKPTCNLIPGMKETSVYILPNETQVYSFKNYVNGYNLIYVARGDDNSTYKLVDPFYKSDTRLIPDTQGHQFNLIDFNIERDGNLAWIQRGSLLGLKPDDKTIFVMYGTLNSQQNIQFNKSLKISTQDQMTCFNVITLTQGRILVDCQRKDQGIDTIYIIDESNDNIDQYNFSQNPITTKRKTISLKIIDSQQKLEQGKTFIFSAWIGSGMQDVSLQNNSIVQIYYMNNTILQYVGQINAANLSKIDLKISDISIDALDFIYITDQRGTVTQLSFDGQFVKYIQTWTFTDSKLLKTSVHITENLLTLVHVVSQTQIFQIDLESIPINWSYQLPNNIQQIINFQVNNELLVVQTQSYYYVYRRYHTQLNNIISTFVSDNSRFVIAPRSPNLVFVNSYQSDAFITSQGFLIIHNSEINSTLNIDITAISASYDRQSDVICPFTFKVNTINDEGYVFEQVQFPISSSYTESPIHQIFDLSKYFLGSRLEYHVTTDSDIQTHILTNDTIKITSQNSQSDVDWFATFSYDDTNYYKLTLIKNNMIIQDCNSNGESISCRVINTVFFLHKIAHYSIFYLAYDVNNVIPVMAYISQGNRKDIVNFIQLNGNTIIPPLIVEDTFNATDVDGNIRYLFVPIRDAKMIKVYKNNLKGEYSLAYTIQQTDIKKQDETSVFLPVQTMLSTTDINILFIKSIDSIHVMKITVTKPYYLSTILLPNLQYSYISSEIVIGKQTMLVFISDNTTDVKDQVLQYGIYNPYQPILLKNIDLKFRVLSRPVKVYSIPNSKNVAVRTQNSNNKYLTFIKMQQPSISSVVCETQIGNQTISLIQSYDSVVVQRIPTASNAIQSTYQYFKLQQSPLLNVRASLHGNNFKQNKSFVLSVRSDNSLLNAGHDINIYDIKTRINPSSNIPNKIHFQSNSNSERTILNFSADNYFVGPVAKYSIEAGEYTAKQIQLIDHVIQLNSTDQGAIVALYHFTNKQIIWAVTHGSIKILDHDLQLRKDNPFSFDLESYIVLGFAPCQQDRFIVFLKNEIGDNYYVALFSTDESRQNINYHGIFQIQKNPDTSIINFQTMKIFKNRIFILDNRLDATGRGIVYVYNFTINDDGSLNPVIYEGYVDYSTFSTLGRINDFELIPQSDGDSALFLATTGAQGIGYGSFSNSRAPFKLTNPKYYLLKNDQRFSNYQIQNSQYQQIQIISHDVNQTSITLLALLTVSNGMHLQVTLVFNVRDTGFNFDGFRFQTQIQKYGKQTVLNWAQTLDGIALIGYEGVSRGLRTTSLGFYSLNKGNQLIRQQMKGAVEQNMLNNLTNNLVALLFKHNSDYRIVMSISEQNNTNLVSYNLSQDVYLSYKVQSALKIDNLKLIASNQYGSNFRLVPVQFDSNPVSHGLAWYVILIIVVVVVIVIGLGVFFYLRHKKRNAVEKDSLISMNKADDQDQQI